MKLAIYRFLYCTIPGVRIPYRVNSMVSILLFQYIIQYIRKTLANILFDVVVNLSDETFETQ